MARCHSRAFVLVLVRLIVLVIVIEESVEFFAIVSIGVLVIIVNNV